MYRDAFLRYPSRPQMTLIMAHGITDLRRWRAALTLWVGRGWAPTNIAGMLDLYDHPERLQERRQPPQPQRTTPAAVSQSMPADLADWLHELSHTGGN
jgi:hypothetical protein